MFRGSILAVGAHPDDIEYAVLGTLLKFKLVYPVYTYVATYGGKGDTTAGANRRYESEKAMGCLDPTLQYWDDRIGIVDSDYHYLVADMEKILIRHEIRTVLAPSQDDSHQDHRLMSQVVVSALRRSQVSLLFYPTFSTLHFSPKIFVEISKQMPKKMDALGMLGSQKDKPYMRPDFIETFHRDTFAMLHGMSYVERFDIGGGFL